MSRKCTLFIFALWVLTGSCFAQAANGPDEKTVIQQLLEGYARSFYQKGEEDVGPFLHPDARRLTVAISPFTAQPVFIETGISELNANDQLRAEFKTVQKEDCVVRLNRSEGIFANAVLDIGSKTEYLQLVKIKDNWTIVNALSVKDGRSVDKSPSAENDQKEIRATVLRYLDGRIGGQAYLLETAVYPEYSNATLYPGARGSFIQRYSLDKTIDRSLQKQGVLDDTMRNESLDIMLLSQRVALVKAVTPYTIEYLHLFQNAGCWRVVNALVRANPDFNFLGNSPVMLEHPMPDFTLPVFGGGEFSLAKHRGKKVMLVFLRGWIGSIWCPLCHYQYLELAALAAKTAMKADLNLEIFVVLPYDMERISDWKENFQSSLDIIEGWKGLTGADEFRDFIKKSYPESFTLSKPVELSIPVLVDADRNVSKRFKLFTKFWDGVAAEQNMAAIYIVDESGVTRFKYVSQQTQDRPSSVYLMDFIKTMK